MATAEFPINQNIYDRLRRDPDSVRDAVARRNYEKGLADQEMPDEGDTLEWASWVAGRRTRIDREMRSRSK